MQDVARRSGSGRRSRGPAYQGGRCGHPGGASAAHAGLCTAVQAPHSYRADLSQRRELPTAGPRPRGRDARELAVSTSLPQHGQSARAQEGGPAHGGVMLTPSPCGQRCALPTRAHDHRDHDRICRSFWTQLVAPTPTARADRREERARGSRHSGEGDSRTWGGWRYPPAQGRSKETATCGCADRPSWPAHRRSRSSPRRRGVRAANARLRRGARSEPGPAR